ncbi:hypothetical protein L211DRAFT_837088 [Terfezia boudieri ATCC MYA-4762]|uniref:Uncharacterized protein n=1 Tax=Terfezia boudieri ATCC MYA-4762 TaxID=1051890 RepID=A0A3N4LPF6_9PEZI|nr:hypothetical protein L211DRAFT_837088 [Terfezia boudieri ATCC MYA-4762]
MLSNKSISDLTSTAAETRKQVARESSSPYADNYLPQCGVSMPQSENIDVPRKMGGWA